MVLREKAIFGSKTFLILVFRKLDLSMISCHHSFILPHYLTEIENDQEPLCLLICLYGDLVYVLLIHKKREEVGAFSVIIKEYASQL